MLHPDDCSGQRIASASVAQIGMPNEIAELRERIDTLTNRVEGARHRVGEAADGLFGPRPEPSCADLKPAASSLTSKLTDLEAAVHALESEIGRF
ncbi:MAG: hypothetical protein ABGX08_17330 [Citromicrobium sp.]